MTDIDEIGAMKLVTPEVRLAALSLVRQARVYRLAHLWHENIPQLADAPDVKHARRIKRITSQTVRPGSLGGATAGQEMRVFSDVVEFGSHSGTHIDALGHWSKHGRLYGGLDAVAQYSESGLAHLGLERCPPIITRGVLLDGATYKGETMLQGGVGLTPADLQGCLKREGLELRAGDAVLLHTGWARMWDQPSRYMAECPGLTRQSAHWLADQGVVAIGADTWVVDTIPPEETGDRRAVHEVCLVERGLPLIENLNLAALAEDRVYEFLFILLPPPFRGGTGFPVEAVAVV